MGYFIADTVGLIIAAINVITFVLMIYIFLDLAAGERSKLYRILRRMMRVFLAPLRKIAPGWQFDISPIIMIVILQVIAFVIKWKYY